MPRAAHPAVHGDVPVQQCPLQRDRASIRRCALVAAEQAPDLSSLRGCRRHRSRTAHRAEGIAADPRLLGSRLLERRACIFSPIVCEHDLDFRILTACGIGLSVFELGGSLLPSLLSLLLEEMWAWEEATEEALGVFAGMEAGVECWSSVAEEIDKDPVPDMLVASDLDEFKFTVVIQIGTAARRAAAEASMGSSWTAAAAAPAAA
eukprot:CAMPEP_0177167654 /NCGR_PEP_ID=MMETSP0367-20130122/8659_1 /TAXON_ID=447022 ORGANISM="Scrippsiella hangoei-like, Strain SHHI-4" /NCGR_SAMPLE_ID=MMETSP0367 /ASSEMBLY_ACC=CAM_ASM_000362 /LENGTH=205 /DNA_ID=CAMNT_0018613757 /DNA_START=336 /DNA_END=952 /DNA_ORIENTATION=+